MATAPRIRGYLWRQHVSRAKASNRQARQALQKILDERPGPQLTAIYITEAALALGENLDAIDALEKIGERASSGGCGTAQPPFGGK